MSLFPRIDGTRHGSARTAALNWPQGAVILLKTDVGVLRVAIRIRIECPQEIPNLEVRFFIAAHALNATHAFTPPDPASCKRPATGLALGIKNPFEND